MTFNILRFCGQISQSLKNVHSLELRKVNSGIKSSQFLSPQHLPIKCHQRTTSFFTKKSGEELWKSVISVSNAGKRRGRGKGGSLAKLKKNLNIGQKVGHGIKRMVWPGLTTAVVQGQMVMQQQRLPDDPDFHKKILEIRDLSNKFKRTKVHPLDRGWTSAKLGGKKIGPPDAQGEDSFEGFETIVLEHKITGHMTGNMGRVRTFSCFVVTGNGNGLVGIALGKSTDNFTSIRNAKNCAGKRLFYINRHNEHTVFHDFFTQFGKCKIYVTQKCPGYGLVCHRVIKAICEMIGIKDLHAKIEGTTNVQTLTKAFLIGLLRQRSHHELAEQKQLHLVELSRDEGYFPKVVASPTNVRTENEIPSTEHMDFKQFVMDGRVILKKKEQAPFYTREPGWIRHLKKAEKLRNKEDVRLQLRAEYGEIRSFMTDKYPEAIPQKYIKQKNEEVEEEQ